MRTILAAALLIHGIAHVVGFVVPWKLVAAPKIPYRTTLLGGAVDVGALGIRIVGIAWLVVAISFVALAATVLRHATEWYATALYLVGLSLVLCVLDLPESRPGLLANAAILALVLSSWLLNL